MTYIYRNETKAAVEIVEARDIVGRHQVIGPLLYGMIGNEMKGLSGHTGAYAIFENLPHVSGLSDLR